MWYKIKSYFQLNDESLIKDTNIENGFVKFQTFQITDFSN